MLVNTHIILTRRDFFISNCIDCQLQASIKSVLSRGTDDKGLLSLAMIHHLFTERKESFHYLSSMQLFLKKDFCLTNCIY